MAAWGLFIALVFGMELKGGLTFIRDSTTNSTLSLAFSNLHEMGAANR